MLPAVALAGPEPVVTWASYSPDLDGQEVLKRVPGGYSYGTEQCPLSSDAVLRIIPSPWWGGIFGLFILVLTPLGLADSGALPLPGPLSS